MDTMSGVVLAGCLVVSLVGATLSLVFRRWRSAGLLTVLTGIAIAAWWTLSQWIGDRIGADRVLYTFIIAGGGALLGAVWGYTAQRLYRR